MKRLNKKIAIITGAADGIGLAITRAFTEEGAIVVMADINENKCKEEADKLVAKGKTALAVRCDVGNTKSVQALIKTCVDHYEKIDILVNNAAVSISGNITDMPEEDWDMIMNINLKSVFRCTQACMSYMLANKKGSIINLSSTQAHRSWNDWTAYAAAKGAILSMTNQLAGQFGKQNIRFNSISPGAIATPMNEKRAEKEGDDFVKPSKNQAAMLRYGQPYEVAMTAVYLASDEAGFVTGTDILVDGGLCTLPRYMDRNN
ncbi:MAG: SDR family oxidoreductase [Flavobacteriaceae bacterium]|nr:SDR family oxidoreductase [Flavobacteriaceae bacterium]